MSMAISPDQRFVVTVNAGYGTFESGYKQSLAVLDTQTGVVEDFPDDRTSVKARQTLYSGLAFSRDGRHIYASMGSETDPLGTEKGDTGSGVVVYGFNAGKISQERMIKIPLQQLAAGRRTMLIGGTAGDKGVPFPAAIAVIGSSGSEKLLVADNLSDDVLLIDPASGAILIRFDLAENDAVPSTYPVALSVSKDESRAFIALWNASEVVELDLKNGVVGRKLALLKPDSKTAAGTHPCALELSGDGRTMYVALANRDAVAAVDVDHGHFAVKGYFDTRLPHQTYFGAEPEALALSPDGSRLYVANAITDAIAVLDTRKLSAKVAKEGMVEPSGFVPTEWMPMSIGLTGGKLYVATAKGKGTGPNNFPQRQSEGTSATRPGPSSYIATLLYGSLAVLDTKAIERDLPKWTAEVVESNRMKAAEEKIRFAGNQQDRIKHVIYIIKENRTYDQILGDLKQNGKAVGNGDSSLTMYGAEITPNQHKLALQFGVLDNFYDSGEVSGDGHVWSTAGIGTDYLEKTWQQSYRGDERTYDFEGVVAEGYPLLQKIPDVNEPNSGYLWGNLARQGKSYYHFGEYISSTFCDAKKTASPQEGPLLEGAKCQKPSILPGETLPVEWGGGVNKWPWPIPLLATNTATKPELVGHFAVEQPDFNLRIPDQIRVDVFLKHFERWVADRESGKDDMPNFILLRLPNDHTAGTTPGGPTPKSSIADNDLAVGRAVDAVSHSAFWDDTSFFILEDDAQAGADHVDAHRSLALVVSKYSPRAAGGGAFVDSRFYSTVSVLRTMETLLGLPPMNNNDAFSSMIGSLFTGDGGQAAFSADYRNRDSGLIYTANTKTAPGAKASQRMDFRHADHADTQKLNVILWKDAMGDSPVPALLNARPKKVKNDDD
ncbi:bifunctional YncE family protein/alkaline phosphatase family protein [Tunturiibacter gelidoferens]|uniref:DNA-binding beta-propeller fold protein YncE n=1 Tax=Tunturiibacter lichenicola TaxID=2051959 RepID=A0A7Y9NLF8_9BACT|nr:bifunctional YncE family protein/alkaline phosphatase family protein [Edaphobacter lichenicola]NYF51549.1 DNA-binding beta-propeller fold protein YncE [Edaphobacter lichenicola]